MEDLDDIVQIPIEYNYKDLVYVNIESHDLNNFLCMVIGKHMFAHNEYAIMVLDESWNKGHNCESLLFNIWGPSLTKKNGLYARTSEMRPYKRPCLGR